MSKHFTGKAVTDELSVRPFSGADRRRDQSLVRAILGLKRELKAHRIRTLSGALLSSTLLYEGSPSGGFKARTRSGLIELFTGPAAFRRRHAAPSPGFTLRAERAAKILTRIVEARRYDGVVFNPAGPARLRLGCRGSAALLYHGKYPVWIV